jgi:hypothetical protein
MIRTRALSVRDQNPMKQTRQASRLPTLFFWGTVAAAVVYFGWTFINVIVNRFYHPMPARANLGNNWFEAFALTALFTMITAAFWAWRRSGRARRRAYSIGALALIVIAVAQFASFFVTTDYRQTYWLDEVRHEIPWQYSPDRGSDEPGGTFFLIEVASTDFTPRYEAARANTVKLGKGIADDGQSDEAPEGVCRTDEYGNTRCWERRGRFVYSLSGKAEHLPSNPAMLLERTQRLLDSFVESS